MLDGSTSHRSCTSPRKTHPCQICRIWLGPLLKLISIKALLAVSKQLVDSSSKQSMISHSWCLQKRRWIRFHRKLTAANFLATPSTKECRSRIQVWLKAMARHVDKRSQSRRLCFRKTSTEASTVVNFSSCTSLMITLAHPMSVAAFLPPWSSSTQATYIWSVTATTPPLSR